MKSKKVRVPPFVMIRKDLLKDPQWRSLSSSSKVIYIYMRGKYNHKTKDKVTLTYKEIEDMLTRPTVSKSIKELIKTGFIEKTKYGGLFGGITQYGFVGQFKDFLGK